jgi:uncharacterized protein
MSGFRMLKVSRWRPSRRAIALTAIALLAGAGGRPMTARAQSFNCAKASTPVELFICGTPALAALDGALGAEIKKTLAAAPANRQAALADARLWLKERDRQCPVPSGSLTAPDSSHVSACLTAMYRERIAALRASPTKPPAPAKASGGKTVICERLVRDYRAALESGSQAQRSISAENDGPLNLLSSGKNAPVTIAKPAVEFTDYALAKMTEWAQKQPQPFVFSSNVLKNLEELDRIQQIDRMPDAPYFAASAIQGTAQCYAGAYFEVKNGRAETAQAPGGWEDQEGGGCGVTRSFGAVGEARAAFEEAHGYGPSLTSRITVTPWEQDHFGAACSVTFIFAPHFEQQRTANAEEESCDGADCETLWQAAQKLAEHTHSDFARVEKAEIARLAPAQSKDYEALKSLAANSGAKDNAQDSGPAPDADSLLDTAPLLLPLISGGQLYLARVGHRTIGWRTFSDWIVRLERLQDGKLAPRATFSIGMDRGRLTKATVE